MRPKFLDSFFFKLKAFASLPGDGGAAGGRVQVQAAGVEERHVEDLQRVERQQQIVERRRRLQHGDKHNVSNFDLFTATSYNNRDHNKAETPNEPNPSLQSTRVNESTNEKTKNTDSLVETARRNELTCAMRNRSTPKLSRAA